MIKNSLLDYTIPNLHKAGKNCYFVTHPKKTKTVEEKRTLINQHSEIYSRYGEIVIVQGSVLSYNDGNNNERIILYFHNGNTKIDFRELKRKLDIAKKRDLRFYKGNLKNFGLENGEVSPFIPKPELIDTFYFDSNLITSAQQNSTSNYDMAISTTQSLFANIADVYEVLTQNILVKDKLRLI